MRRYILTILALAAFATTYAQEFNYGVKVGMNVASAGLHGADIEGRDQYRSPRVGVVAGLTTEYKFKKPFSLSAEVLFSQQGMKYSYDRQATVDGSEAKVTHRFSYLNVPILFNYYFVADLPLSFNIGIQPGFLLSENGTTVITEGSSTEKVDGALYWDSEYDRYRGSYYNFDLALPIGFTYKLTKSIAVDMRYSIGLINTFRAPSDDDYEKEFRSTNNTFSISVGYRF